MQSSDGLEIERKFLLREFPPHVKKENGVHMLQGYISSETADVEVRIRSAGEKRYLTLKEGRGMVRREEEIFITAENFESFWPFTLDARVSKTRYCAEEAGLVIEIDEYHDSLTSLVVAEVELPPGLGFTEIDLPDWLGAEITGLPEFTNQHMARHGLPGDLDETMRQTLKDKTRPITHAGAIPFRFADNNLEILSIRTRRGEKWVVPMGTWDTARDLDETATAKAWEKAGVVGVLDKKALGIYEDEVNGERRRVELFALEVEQQEEDWPDKDLGTRRWLDVDQAISTVSSPGIGRLIEKLRVRLSGG